MARFGGNPDQLRAITNQVNGYVEQYHAEVNAIYSQVEAAKQSWTGTSEEDYVQKANDCRPDLEKLGEKIGEYANWLTNTANALESMDSSIRF